MKIPSIFVPEKDLEEKIIDLSAEKTVKAVNVEEQAKYNDMLEEEYNRELKKKRKRWHTGDHLNRPGTERISPKRLLFNIGMMGLSIAGAVYLGREIQGSIPNYILIPYAFGSIVAFPMATYKIISEAMIRYDVWKDYKSKK